MVSLSAVARACISAPTMALDSVLGGEVTSSSSRHMHMDVDMDVVEDVDVDARGDRDYLREAMRSVHSTVGAAEAVTLASLFMARTATAVRSYPDCCYILFQFHCHQ